MIVASRSKAQGQLNGFGDLVACRNGSTEVQVVGIPRIIDGGERIAPGFRSEDGRFREGCDVTTALSHPIGINYFHPSSGVIER